MQKSKEFKQRSLKVVKNARKAIEEAAPKVRAIRQSNRFTEQGKREAIKGGLAEIRNQIHGNIVDLQQAIRSAVEREERRLEELRHVPADELTASAQILAPVLSAAGQNPEVLINAYAKRHQNLADRHLLEETAQGMIDAGLGGVGFAEKWSRAQMSAEIPAEDREAAAEIESLREVANYVGSAAMVLGMDLNELERPLEVRETMLRETPRAGVHRFENSAKEASETAA